MERKILARYTNGNVDVILLDDGTKIRRTRDDEFKPVFPENFDYKITNKCPYGCKFCHEDSTITGLHGDIMNDKFIETLHAGTECAIGGGAITSHPDLIPFLKKLKSLGVIANATVNQRELEDNYELVTKLLDEKLIYGLGVSYNHPDPMLREFAKKYPNTVLHLIAGVHTKEDFEELACSDFKILILGYKNLRRGNTNLQKHHDEIDKQINWLKSSIMDYAYNGSFKTISFDNLALEQLGIKSQINADAWEKYYQGEDGSQTMFIDSVKKEFARMSTSLERFPIKDNIVDMFNTIRIDC